MKRCLIYFLCLLLPKNAISATCTDFDANQNIVTYECESQTMEKSIDSVDENGNTALCRAILSNDVKTYQILKDQGANTNHQCVQKIPSKQYKSFIEKTTVKKQSWSFLNLGKVGWGVVGLGVAGGAVAVAISGKNNGSGSAGSSNGDSGTGGQNNTQSCQEKGYIYKYSDLCPDGWVKNNSDSCSDDNIVSWFKCNMPQTCSAPYYTECVNGYEEVPGDICLSGTTVYKRCVASSCTGYTYDQSSICPDGWQKGSSCLSGTTIKYKCDIPTICDGYQTSCDFGYTEIIEDTCKSGDTTLVKCEFDNINYIQQNNVIYHKLNCVHGNQTANVCSCDNGWDGDLCNTEIQCGYNTTECPDGYIETGVSCQSGDTLYKECTPVLQCGANAHQNITECQCDYGYENFQAGIGCSLIELNCGTNAHQNGAQCQCDNGYENLTSNGCSQINCGANATWSPTGCICDSGYGNWQYGNGCFDTSNCGEHAYKQGSDCVCEPGYTNWLWTVGCSPIADAILIDNSSDGTVIGSAYNLNGIINIHNTNLNSNIYGTTSGTNGGIIYINNHGNGNVYGAAKNNSDYGYTFNLRKDNYSYSVLATSDIIVKNYGDGDVYGMYRKGILDTSETDFFSANLMLDTASDGNYYKVDLKSTIDLNNTGNGNVYGMYGWYLFNAYAYNTHITSDSIMLAEIHIMNDGTGNAYGMYVPSSNEAKNNGGTNAKNAKGIITLINKNDGHAYGMFGENIKNRDTTGFANINITNYANGNVFGMHGTQVSNESPNYTSSIISLQNLGSGRAIGAYTRENGLATNSGTININNIGTGTAIGIFGDTNSTITNSGIINITRDDYVDEDEILHTPTGTAGNVFGIYVKSGGIVNNSGTINITSNGNLYGIYAEPGATVTNTGTISLNGVMCDGSSTCDGNNTYNNYIVLNGGNLYNSGLMMAPQMNLDSVAGNVVAGLGAQFIVDNELSGNLNISSALVQNSNQTTYVAQNMIDAGDVSNLNVRSASAMFNASLADNGHDIIMQMKDFNELTNNKSLASFLKNNYDNNNGTELFNALKSMDNISAFNGALSGLAGMNTFTRFAHEDLAAMREISFSMNNKLFENSERDSFDISDSMGYFSFSDSHNGGSGQYGISSDKISDNWKLGYGMAMANINTGDMDNIHRQNKLWLFYMPATYTNDRYELVVAPKAGFAHSEYNRRGYNNMNYDGYIEKIIFGLMNDLRYPLTFGNWTVAPDLALNAIIYSQNGQEDEQEFSLVIPEDKTVSVETGLGVYTKYEKAFNNGARLKLNSGLMVYREFGDTYDIKLGMRGMDGTFNLYNNNYEYRGAANLGFDYTAGRLHMYGNAQYFMDNANYMNFKGGINYRF